MPQENNNATAPTAVDRVVVLVMPAADASSYLAKLRCGEMSAHGVLIALLESAIADGSCA